MPKRRATSEPEERPYTITGVCLPADIWKLSKVVAFERARTKGGRVGISALLVDMIEEYRTDLQIELGKTVR
jgi:hypothetical protein